MHTFEFPVGYHQMHKTKIIDYQLNRWYSLGYASLSDLQKAARQIRGLDDWKDVMLAQANSAEAEGRLMQATFYVRAAEFFTRPSDPDKLPIYERFQDLFYNQLFSAEPFTRHAVAYGDSGATLPALHLPAQTDSPRGQILLHGGFDSFIEELYSVGATLAHAGYEVVMFEGPGQGAALKQSGLPLTYQWEQPVSAVLDHFGWQDVTLLGYSMGGWMCFRAAAFEPRIQRVIASSIAYDYMEIPPEFVANFARWLMKHRGLMNWMSELKMKAMPQERWGIENLMYITHTTTPLDASQAILEFNAANLHSAEVTQDVLIQMGTEDHFIPMKLYDLQMAALSNARSLTGRVFTPADQAQNHCQVGNIGLAVSEMIEWLGEKTPISAEIASQ